MAKKVTRANPTDVLKKATAAGKQVTEKTQVKKTKPNSDYIRLDLKPFGFDLKDYADKKAAALSIERGRKVSTTAFIQELIIADMEADKGKGKPTKHDKIISALNNIDDKKLSAIATLLDIQVW